MNAEPPIEAHLDRETLTDIVDLALWAGKLVMENGAESRRVEETVRLMGTGLGCDWGNVLVSYNALIVTHISGDEFRTKIRRISGFTVNMSLIEAVSHLVHRVEEGKLDRFAVRARLEEIGRTPRVYSRWLTVLAVGAGCAAFSQLFGGGWQSSLITFIAAAIAMVARQELLARHFNNLLVTLLTALLAGLLVGATRWVHLSERPETALAAAVLFLVPGVPFINAVEDLIKEYTLVGMARAVTAMLVILAIALGLLLALRLTGLPGV